MIQSGEILLLGIPLVTPPHDKFVLVLAVSPKAYFVFINSHISDFIQAELALRQAQISIDSASHNFLDYDSFIECSQPFYQGEMDLRCIYEQLQREPWRHKGKCSSEVLKQVLVALNEARTVSERIRNATRKSLLPLLAEP